MNTSENHKLSLFSAILLNLNILVGSAVLFGTSLSTAASGNASFLSWALVALFFLPLVLCTARLSSMFSAQGGIYSYAKQGINPLAGYISAFLYLTGYTFAVVVETFFIRQMLLSAVGPCTLLDSPLLFNALFILLCCALNSLPFSLFSKITSALSITKILPLATLICLIPFIINPSFTITSHELLQLPYGLPFVIFGYWGFEYCCSFTHLIKNSSVNAPRATIIGFAITVLLYTLFHFGLLNLMGAENLAHLGVAQYPQFLHLPIPHLKSLLILLIPITSVLTLFSTANGILNANILVMHALAQENLFWKSSLVQRVNRFNRPWVALVIQAIIIFSLVSFLPINMIGNLCNLATVTAFFLPLISLLLIEKQRNNVGQILLCIAALGVILLFSLYSWYLLGSDMYSRMIGTLLYISLIVGSYILYTCREKKAL